MTTRPTRYDQKVERMKRVMYYLDGFTMSEIARYRGVTRAAVSAVFHKTNTPEVIAVILEQFTKPDTWTHKRPKEDARWLAEASEDSFAALDNPPPPEATAAAWVEAITAPTAGRWDFTHGDGWTRLTWTRT